MLFSIQHTIRFFYTATVFVEPLIIRLCPRSDPGQRLLQFQLILNPEPAGTSDCLELDGNCATHAWFDGLHDSVTITALSEVETLRNNPFDLIFYPPDCAKLPITYSEPIQSLLKPYSIRQAAASDVDCFADEILRQTESRTIPFLEVLCQTISRDFKKIERRSGEPLHPAQTLAYKEGACRDLAVLFMDACKALGLATRFVSGYSGSTNQNVNRELHAWEGVYLPGGGWRGYDPSLGVAVADNHVALAASPIAQGAAPVQGRFRGTGVDSALEHEVNIRTSSEGSQCH